MWLIKDARVRRKNKLNSSMSLVYMVSFLLLLLLLVPGSLQWQNSYDGALDVECGTKAGFNRVRSSYSGWAKDRVWQWDCHDVSEVEFGDCYWTGYVNWFDNPVYVQCEPNYILSGVYSYHANWAEDRRWRIRCCKATNHFTGSCEVSEYTNSYHGGMDYSVSLPRVFTGMFSAHMNSPE